jgi:hypothetical protein
MAHGAGIKETIMATNSWHTSRDIDHEKTQDFGLARAGGRRKTASDPVPVTHGMHERTNTSVGAPPRDNNPPDASSPLPTDPEKQHGSKTFPVPACHPHMRSDPQRGSYDLALGDKVIGQAIISGSTKLPAAVKED